MKGDWHKTVQPVMTAYKLVTIEFKWMGLQNKVEKYIMETGKIRNYINAYSDFWCIAIDCFREETFHQLPPAALLHNRQMD